MMSGDGSFSCFNYEDKKIIYNRCKLDWYWAPLFLAFWASLFYAIVLPSFNNYPELLATRDENKQPGQFIGERAENTLSRLTMFGPRVTGSEQEAIDFLWNEITEIIAGSRKDLYEIEKQIQVASSNYLRGSMVNFYQDLQNVVVRVSPLNSNSTAALLINSHLDTFPGSTGAGDAGLLCAIMLEVLRVLTKYETALQNSVIFLFNEGGENQLQGSHAFITKQKWAKDVRAIINLDAVGLGGRELLLQSSPNHPWLIRYYGGSVSHPFANVFVEEAIQKGFVSFETDYRIFSEFGKVPSLDVTKIDNAYLRHTRYDVFNALLRSNAYQMTGENLLALVKALANAPELAQAHPDLHTGAGEGEQLIYFDVLGWFFVSYSASFGRILNISVCMLLVFSIGAYVFSMSYHTGKFKRFICMKFVILLAVQLASILLALLLMLVIGYLLDMLGSSMSWYAQRWLILGIYFYTMFFGLSILPACYISYTKDHGLSLSYAVQLLMHAHGLFLALSALVLTILDVRSTYMITIALGCYTLGVLINIVTVTHGTNFLWLLPHCACHLLPYVFYLYCSYGYYSLMIPLQGYMHDINPELYIAGYTFLICLLFVPFLLPILFMFRKSKTIIALFGVCALCCALLAVTSLGFPYIEKTTPQRFYVLHTSRTFYTDDGVHTQRQTDSGYYVLPLDRHPHTLDAALFVNGNYTKISSDECEAAPVLFCGYPIYNSHWLNAAAQSYWIPAKPPTLLKKSTLKVVNRKRISATNMIFTLEISGPDHTNIFIQPHNGSKLVDWSFTKEPLKRKNIKPPYFIYSTFGISSFPLNFYVEFEHATPNWTGSTFNIVVIGHNMLKNIYFEDYFSKFLQSLPPWAHATSWLAEYVSWHI